MHKNYGEWQKYGLRMDAQKTKRMIFNSNREEIEEVNNLKYLDITVQNLKNVYGKHRRNMIDYIKRMKKKILESKVYISPIQRTAC